MIHKQFAKFLVIGGFSTIVNYAVFYGLFRFIGISYTSASIIGFVCGIFAGYQFNKNWTFSVKNSKTKHVLPYFAVYCVSLVLGIAFLKFLVEVYKVMPEIANFLMICLTTCTNFIGTKFLVFKK